MEEIQDSRSALSVGGWIVAFVAAVAAAGLLFFGDNPAMEQAAAIDNGTAETRSARLDAWLDTHARDRVGWSRDRIGRDEWKARFVAEGENGFLDSDGGFNVPGRGEVLHDWDGAQVTAYMWGDSVIGVKLPDGMILKSDGIGWRGSVKRYGAAVFAVGLALLIGAAKLRMGFWTGFAGGVLLTVTLVAGLHLEWLGFALIADAVILLACLLFVARRLRRSRSESASSGRTVSPPAGHGGSSPAPSLFDD